MAAKKKAEEEAKKNMDMADEEQVSEVAEETVEV